MKPLKEKIKDYLEKEKIIIETEALESYDTEQLQLDNIKIAEYFITGYQILRQATIRMADQELPKIRKIYDQYLTKIKELRQATISEVEFGKERKKRELKKYIEEHNLDIITMIELINNTLTQGEELQKMLGKLGEEE